MNTNLYRRFLLLSAKGLVLALTLYLLYYTVSATPDTLITWRDIVRGALKSPLRPLLLLVALLIPVNWGFEARKWQLLSKKIEHMSFRRAYRSVMVGLTLGFITPHRLGDYAGRVLELKSQLRLEAIGAIFIGRFCQLAATIIAGSFGLLYFLLRFCWPVYPAVAMSAVGMLAAICVLVLLLLYNASAMVSAVAAIKPLRHLVQYIAVMGTYSSMDMSRLLLLSVGRYAVFLLQFVLLLVVYDVKMSLLQYVSGVSGTFYLKSVVPSVSLLSDLGVRELSAMYLFGLLGQVRLKVLSASLSLWLLNVAVPSAVGLVFVLRLRLARARRGVPA